MKRISMKRISLILLTGLLFNALAMAQVRNFEQRGRATQELRSDGLSIAHPSLPLNSRVMVVNTVSGREIEAMVTGRIAASPNRIADLSPGAWQELGLSPTTDIRIYTAATAPRPRPTAAPLEPAPTPVLAAAPSLSPRRLPPSLPRQQRKRETAKTARPPSRSP